MIYIYIYKDRLYIFFFRVKVFNLETDSKAIGSHSLLFVSHHGMMLTHAWLTQMGM